MAAPRIRIQGKTYKVPTIEDLTLDDILVLDAELQERYRSSWAKVQQFVRETAEMTEEEAELHPGATMMGGVTVWMVLRVSAKREISMQEALSIPSDSIEDVVTDGPKDRQPSKKAARSRKSSAAAAGGRARAGSTSTSSSPTSLSEK